MVRRDQTPGVTVCEQFGIAPSQLAARGAFNAPLWEDARYFIDPRLLKACTEPEFDGAAERAYTEFAKTMKFIARAREDDRFREAALKRLTFHETPGLMLGLSESCSGGRGVGQKLAGALFTTMDEFIQAGLDDPALMGVIAVVQENFGPDRISDMLAHINLDAIAQYSSRVFRELGVPGQQVPGQEGIVLPKNPCNGSPVLLVPRSVLRPLEGLDPYRAWFGDNEDLRKFFSEQIQSSYDSYQPPTKADYRRAFLGHPEKFGELAETFKKARPEPYDFEKDPKGLQPYDRALDVARSHQMPVELANPTNPADFLTAVNEICEHFRQEVEATQVLRGADGSAFPEKKVQAVFRAVASGFARQLGIDLNGEPNNGRGPVDFKFSIGAQLRSLVEVKLASNDSVIKGYEAQLEVYRKQEPNSSAVYLVVAFNQEFNVRDQLLALWAKQNSPAAPRVVFVDASLKPSASKARDGK